MTIPLAPDQLVIHDTSPIVDGSTARESLQRSIELARLGNRLGFRRYWAAEVHGMRGVASCAPAVLAGMVASRTTSIRVGAGGVLLPYHAPLVVSEQFGTLEAVHPGRIDLALGRGAGGPKAAQAAVNGARDDSVPAFSQSVDEVRAYFRNEVHENVRSVPGFGNEPQMWLLGSRAESARLAADKRMPYAFGGHYNRSGSEDAADAYLAAGRGDWAPYLGVWVGVIAADDADHAEFLAGSYRLRSMSSKLWGRRMRLPSPEEAAAWRPSGPDEARAFAGATAGFIIGDGATVRRELAEFRDRTRADELIIRTPVHDREAKLRSFALLAGD
ncbi:MAG: MsnO8 family LLM class oxidoreductase [Actinomycetota bacterium]|nr:MsnO8 family LLM class oxidoreductase [Actinomycetota bacterium]